MLCRERGLLMVLVALLCCACPERVVYKEVPVPVYVNIGGQGMQPEIYYGLGLEAWNEAGGAIGIRGRGWAANATDMSVEIHQRPVWVVFTDGENPGGSTRVRLPGHYYAHPSDTVECRVLAPRQTVYVWSAAAIIDYPAYWGICWEAP